MEYKKARWHFARYLGELGFESFELRGYGKRKVWPIRVFAVGCSRFLGLKNISGICRGVVLIGSFDLRRFLELSVLYYGKGKVGWTFHD